MSYRTQSKLRQDLGFNGKKKNGLTSRYSNHENEEMFIAFSHLINDN